ncbi:hypothetical protein BVRB_020630 [Beta vulgaris subsp. vulgaris]|uniref:Glycosyltransferase 61 catalytic domain-containing protein n=1 Tax=Beta vulgaris subsp. vulgaris TaxID=3555 RepID=A0A0J8B0L5_BETVV|nr:hypothetical protein BVRB_020630 [Beta vulgaris subsp. vulgaris]
MQALRRSQPDAVLIDFGPNENLLNTAVKHYNADIVIGPHGAGLSNIIFCPDGATLIELHPRLGNEATEGPHHVNGCHQRTARKSALKPIMLLEDNGTDTTKFTANITRVVDAVAKVRDGADLDSIDRYISWQF